MIRPLAAGLALLLAGCAPMEQRSPAWVQRIMAKTSGTCKKCERPWRYLDDGHCTMVGEYWGVSPLCKRCWMSLKPNDRLPFYHKMYMTWERPVAQDHGWELIAQAVLREDSPK